jgi:quercetin dioxygenase-like cupin family protein
MHEQTTQVTEGKLEMTIDGVTQILEPDMITLIPSNVIHSARALTDCKVTDIFFPVREDYK